MSVIADFDLAVDYLVVGSGGGGLLSAIVASDAGLDVLVVEKGEYYGGTTALSGGVVWIPNNHLKEKAGLDDSDEKALRYLKSVMGDEADLNKLNIYIKYARIAAQYMDNNTEARWRAHPKFMDYFPENDGGTPGGRSIEPVPINGKRLGRERERLPASSAVIMKRFRMTASEGNVIAAMNLKSYWCLAKIIARYYLDIPSRLRGLSDARLTNGSALIGGLRLSLEKNNVPLWCDSPAVELIVDGDKVAGCVVEHEAKKIRIRATKGVLLATGGFAQNQALRSQYQVASASSEWTLSSVHSQGDAITMTKAVDAALEHMDTSWWTPVLKHRDGSNEFFLASRGMPHSIMVDQRGKRFLNEAGSYDEVGKGIHRANTETASAIPCYFIFDGTFRRNSPMGMQIPPSKIMPDSLLPADIFASGWLKKADSLAELAEQISVDVDTLAETVKRFNSFVPSGKDLDFRRGDSLHDHFFSNTKVGENREAPNPSLGGLVKPPFYAVEVFPGDLDTKGGLKTDEYARVLNTKGEIVEGLYAAGNCAGSMMGNFYPAGGSTIGPSLTFGYIAAKLVAGKLDELSL